MPSRTLPTFTRAEVESHASAASCFVAIGTKVYDVTDFVDDHPGGGDLLLQYAGKDVGDILKGPTSHPHSEAAHDVLDELLAGLMVPEKAVGANSFAHPKAEANGALNGSVATEPSTFYVHPRTGMSCEEDLSRETDISQDYRKYKFLDLNRPLFLQVWNGRFSKEFYMDQVHRPRHYKGGDSAPLFGNFLEPLTKTPWWMVPTIWLPCVCYGVYLANQGHESPLITAAYWVFGVLLWTLIEYCMHRFLFHIDDYLPDNRVGITAHFLLHGIHHYLPMDKYRLVMPPVLFVVLATPFWKLYQFVFAYNWYVGTAVYCGSVFGYICYDLTHYFLHHENPSLWFGRLKKYHLQHHFLDYDLGFGVTSKFWDTIFSTELQPSIKTK
ncbi:4-hydroxysphinganine ceramide fatty acyl 2-hydroxylase [Purpureocillium takamizusanense]|uniref:Ceramide very long chain fatty acid hydroxylase n=1 Tax=Purpureocillium takamizusanense TaxID=2060973 RepID=A0A9Q8QCC9_9HYPO|nr:4-hydroxysphinganine ceramide fatty acyl 2-hydroxylase [Purpureocillium takamizusanense]UNI16662.1 4-hydroxysphinganine ceramide fatty acyl 2-hydroxylase [Purpureocillium takamizusanense]